MIQCAHDPCQRPQRPTSKTPRWVLRALGVCGVCFGHTSARGCRRGPRFQVHVARWDGATALRTICARRTPSCQSMDDAWMMHAARSCAGVRWEGAYSESSPDVCAGCNRRAARVLYGMRICARAAPVRTCAAPATQVPPPHAHTRCRLQIAEPSLTCGKDHVRKTQK